MALQPIDLQTLYGQLDKVSKAEAFQQQGMQLSHAVHQAEMDRRAVEKNAAVKDVPTDNVEANVVNDHGGRGQQQSGGKRRQHTPESEAAIPAVLIRDPALGRHIDISR